MRKPKSTAEILDKIKHTIKNSRATAIHLEHTMHGITKIRVNKTLQKGLAAGLQLALDHIAAIEAENGLNQPEFTSNFEEKE